MSEESSSSETPGEAESGSEATDEPGTADGLLREHLILVHAVEIQAISELDDAMELSKGSEMEEFYGDHLEQVREHERQLNERLQGRGQKPEAVRDLTMKAASEVGLRDLKERPPDTPVKLAGQTFTVDQLEIAAYEFLARLANEAGDGETGDLAQSILEHKREMAEKMAERFEKSVELMFEAARSSDEEESDEDGDERQDDSEESEDREPSGESEETEDREQGEESEKTEDREASGESEETEDREQGEESEG